MRLGEWELRDVRPIAGGGLDALAADPAGGPDVRLWIGAPGRPAGADAAAALAELRARLARVYHAALPRPLGEAVVEGRPVLRFRAYAGRPLAEVLAEGTPEPPVALDWARGVGAALVKAHAAGVVHGALDEDAIWIAEGDGRPLLLHLGFGPFLEPRPPRAPEDVGMPAGSDTGDVFGLGRVLVRALTGVDPAAADPAADDPAARLSTLPEPSPEDFPPGLPEGLRRLLARALRPGIAGRLSRAEELTGDLGVIRASWEAMTAAREEPVMLPFPGLPRPRTLLALAAAVVVVALLLGRGCARAAGFPG